MDHGFPSHRTVDEVLVASVEEGRRVIALEIEERDRQYRLTERILWLAVAILAGAITVVGLLIRHLVLRDPVVAVGIAVGVILNVAGAARAALLSTTAEKESSISVGPRVVELARHLDDPLWQVEDLYRSLLSVYGVMSAFNQHRLVVISVGLRASLILLSLGVVLYLRMLTYILGRLIFGVA